MSADMADRLLMVSSSDSPLLVDDALMFRLSTSADSRLAAISKVVRVRVEFSKNRLNTLLPRSSGTFLTSRSESDSDTNWLAVSRMCVIMSRDNPSIDSRCFSSPFLVSCGLRNVLIMAGRARAKNGGGLVSELGVRRARRAWGMGHSGGFSQWRNR
ncbi:hypothetical protein D9M72_408020 [compost metagenome]